MLELVVFVVILCTVTFLWRPQQALQKGGGSRGPSPKNPFMGRYTSPPKASSDHIINKGAMNRCHNCSAFFPAGNVVHEIVQGHLLEFCSKSCRNNFLGATD